MDSRDRKRVSVLSVKDFLVAETGDCRMRRLLPAQAGDKPHRATFSVYKNGARFAVRQS